MSSKRCERRTGGDERGRNQGCSDVGKKSASERMTEQEEGAGEGAGRSM